MSKYTTELRFICEAEAGLDESVGYNDTQQVIDDSWEKIFSFSFPIFDPNYKSVLCKKIIKHYYTREIGLETYGLWKLKLDTKMNEIMPYYNDLYRSANLEFNPLYDADYRRIHEGSGSGEGERSETRANSGARGGTDSRHNVNKYSDTPQGALVNVEAGTYLTNATVDDSSGSYSQTLSDNGSTNGTNSYSTTDEYVDHIVGKFPGSSYAKMITEYRKTLLNIDMRIIEELSDLFMLIW